MTVHSGLTMPCLLMILVLGSIICLAGQQLVTGHLLTNELERMRSQTLHAAMALRDEHPMSEPVPSYSSPLTSIGVESRMVSSLSSVLSRSSNHSDLFEGQMYSSSQRARSSISEEFSRPFERIPRPQVELVGASRSSCTQRKPYHVLLTAASGIYQEWQTRIAYYHYKKMKAMHPCSDLGGFTRLLNTQHARPDGLMAEIPTVTIERDAHPLSTILPHATIILPTALPTLESSSVPSHLRPPDPRASAPLGRKLRRMRPRLHRDESAVGVVTTCAKRSF